MDDAAFYRSIYRMLEGTAPLGFDCGRLCGSACCKPGPELPGMYLFPGEEALYAGISGFTLSTAPLPRYGPAILLGCQYPCDRQARPLSCRIFPLAPKAAEGTVYARLDPRGRAVCPLCRQDGGALSSGFRLAVERSFAALRARPGIKAFIEALSHNLDHFEQSLHL